MRAIFDEYGNATFYREEGDPKFYGIRNSAGESRLLYYVKNWLNERGFDLIKKRAAKDGHLVTDTQQYIRSRNSKAGTPHVYILNPRYAIRGAENPWNTVGNVTLEWVEDVWGKDQDTWALIQQLAADFGDIEVADH